MNVKSADISDYAVAVAVKEQEKTGTTAKATKHFLMPAFPCSEHLLLRRSKYFHTPLKFAF